MSPDRRYRIAAAAVLAAALALRVAYVLHTPGYVPAHDDQAYDRLALGVARTGAYPGIPYPTAYRPPAYPYFLGFVYWLAGPGHARIWAARLVQAGTGTLLVGLLGLTARRLFGRAEALATMLVAALYVPFIAVGAGLFAETQSTVLEVSVVLAALSWRQWGGIRWAVATGVLIGLLTLTRSNAFVVGIAVVAGMVWNWRVRAAAVTVLSAAVVVAPWTVRNALVMHSFIPVSDEEGGTLAGTYNPVSAHDRAAPAYWHLLAQIPAYSRDVRPLLTGPEPALQSRLLHLALSYIGAHPLYPFTVALWNTLRLAGLTGMAQARYDAGLAGIGSPSVAEVGVYCFWVVAALAAAGVAVRGIRRRVPGFVWLVAGLLFLSVILVNGEAPRLRIPIDPFVILVAGAALTWLIRAARGRREAPAA